MKKIAVANQKGGCGKTTTSINLAGALSSIGKKTLIIDMDPQAHASFGIGVSYQSSDRSIYNVLTENSGRSKNLDDCIIKITEKLHIVPANILVSTLEQELSDKEDAVSALNLVLTSSSLNYDYIIIDCPPNLGFLTFNALRAADRVIIPIDMSAFSLMGAGKLIGMMDLIKIKINHSPQVSALATLYDNRTKYSQKMHEEISTFFKSQMFATIIHLNDDLKKSAAKGECITHFNKKSRGAKDYTDLARELIKIDKALEIEKALKEASMVKMIPKPSRQNEKPITPRTLVSQNLKSAENIKDIPNNPINIQNKPKITFKEVRFNINAPNAKDIFIVGDFNGWQASDEHRLSRSSDGKWSKSLNLSSGKYKYKFIVDGEWVIDSQNKEREQNQFGTFDSIIKL